VFVDLTLQAKFLFHVVYQEFQPIRPLRPVSAIFFEAVITQVSLADDVMATRAFSMHNVLNI
jgi:hypothetical protein